jgi:HK97 family phage prohead protease
MNADLEYKTYPLDVRSKEEAEQGVISGYASTYAKDAYGDVVSPGAFAQSITDKKGKYPILFGHDSTAVVGFSTHVSEDHKGLQMDAQLSLGTSGGRDAFELIKTARAVDFKMGLSIGFITREWDMEGDVRVLKEIDLWEVSLTVFPANKMARVEETRATRGRSAADDALRAMLWKTRARLALIK